MNAQYKYSALHDVNGRTTASCPRCEQGNDAAEERDRDDDYHEGAFYLAALCCVSVVLVMAGGALALIGSCR